MMMIYSPSGLRERQEEQLDEALARDGARVHYQGNDGDDEYVIVEARDFRHTEEVGRALGLSLVLTPGGDGQPPRKRKKT